MALDTTRAALSVVVDLAMDGALRTSLSSPMRKALRLEVPEPALASPFAPWAALEWEHPTPPAG